MVGGAVWIAPAIQSVNMTKAWAAVGSGPHRDPGQCYSVDIDIDPYGGITYDDDTGFRCLSPQGAWTGGRVITATSDGAGGWIVTVGAPGVQIVEGFAKARDTAPDASCNPGTLTATNAMRFAETTNAHGKPIPVRDVELTFCVSAA